MTALSIGLGLFPFTILTIPLIITGCEASTQTPIVQETLVPTLDLLSTPVITDTPQSKKEIIVWVPPQFSPTNGSDEGNLFQKRMDSFLKENPEIAIQVRIKPLSGPSNLLESLTNTIDAAPSILPALIAISRQDLETAALKGLVVPIDGLTTINKDPDWYNYARQMAIIQGSTFGLPFAGDALVLCYRPEKMKEIPKSWESILKQTTPLAFPASDSQALLTITLYQSLGGLLEDNQNRPLIQPEILKTVLDLMLKGATQGIFPQSLVEFKTDSQVWQSYKDQRFNGVISWISNYLSDFPTDTVVQPLPVLGKSSFTLSNGYVWAIANPDSEKQKLGIQLAEYLVDSNFLADWTNTAGFLPTKPTVLAAWKNQNMQSILSQVIPSAQTLPTNDILAGVGPVFEETLIQVLNREIEPKLAAENAANRILAPENK